MTEPRDLTPVDSAMRDPHVRERFRQAAVRCLELGRKGLTPAALEWCLYWSAQPALTRDGEGAAQ